MTLLRILPLLLFLGFWQASVTFVTTAKFFFGSPLEILTLLVQRLESGELIRDTFITSFEAIGGFLIGTTLGTLVGIGLWISRSAFDIARPYVVALGAAPVFALSPVIVVWFGTGIESKIFIAAFSTVFVALSQAYLGAKEAEDRYSGILRALGATKAQVLRKAIAPGAAVWVIAGLRLNVGFALLGAFVGEFVSSSEGLGHMILVASGLFNMSLVLLGVLSFILVALAMNWAISVFEPSLRHVVSRYL